MLRNALSLGFNDNLLDVSNKRFTERKGDLWKEMKQGEFPDLLDDSNLPIGALEEAKKQIISLIRATEKSYVLDNFLGKTGSPQVINLKISDFKKINLRLNKSYRRMEIFPRALKCSIAFKQVETPF
mgnify:CR=1 FL=1